MDLNSAFFGPEFGMGVVETGKSMISSPEAEELEPPVTDLASDIFGVTSSWQDGVVDWLSDGVFCCKTRRLLETRC